MKNSEKYQKDKKVDEDAQGLRSERLLEMQHVLSKKSWKSACQHWRGVDASLRRCEDFIE